MKQIRPTTAHIDLDRLRHNLGVVRSQLGPGVKVLAAVKGDAYGHGLEEASRALDAAGVDVFGVALVEEGKALRDAGITKPILCLGGVGQHGALDALEHGLTSMLYDLDAARDLDAAARALRVRAPVHLKVDTGMGRLGVQPGEWESFLDRLAELEHLDVQGIATHLAEADLEESFSTEQARRFDEAVDAARLRSLGPGTQHFANSAAALRFPEMQRDMVRVGLALYGISPSEHLALDLRPALRVTTEVLFVKDLPMGAGVSYGRRWIAPRPTRLATLPVGYADGYPRSLSGVGEVLVHGHRAPVRGAVCMDMILVDVTDVPQRVRAGDEVELLGDGVRADELAAWAGTIPYEIVTGFSSRIPRVFAGGAP